MSGDVCVHFRNYSSPLLFLAQFTYYFIIVIRFCVFPFVCLVYPLLFPVLPLCMFLYSQFFSLPISEGDVPVP